MVDQPEETTNLQYVGHVDVADRNMDDQEQILAVKKRQAEIKAAAAEAKEEARLDKETKTGPDGLVHEEDGTKINPGDGKAIEDDGDLVG